jgi:hypothetical protein
MADYNIPQATPSCLLATSVWLLLPLRSNWGRVLQNKQT